MTDTCIILAGGLATRLKDTLVDIPKSMAKIGDKPFLAYLLDYLQANGIKQVVLSVGHRHQPIKDYFGNKYKSLAIVYAIEEEPLGTGGAIANALQFVQSDELFVLNGDTYFPVDLAKMEKTHRDKKADLTIALKEMIEFDRYGTVKVNKEDRIEAFVEKSYREQGLVNGGIYRLKKSMMQNGFPEKFSFEKDVLENRVNLIRMYGYISAVYFIDIGIPEDLKRAQIEMASSGY